MLSAERIISSIDEVWNRRRREIAPATSIRASLVGHPCLRAIVYPILMPEVEERSPSLQKILHEGNVHEEDVFALLTEAGKIGRFKLERAGIRSKWMIAPIKHKELGYIPITGKVDGVLIDLTDRSKYVVEIKSVGGNSFKQMATLESFLQAPYRQRWYAQLQIYLFQLEVERGFFVIKNRDNGELHILPVEIDFEYTEELLRKAEEAWWWATYKRELPPAKLEDPKICQYCPYAAHCLPNLEAKPLTVKQKEELEALLEERERFREAKSQFEKIDRKVKEILNSSELKQEGRVILGKFLLENKNGRWKITKLMEDE